MMALVPSSERPIHPCAYPGCAKLVLPQKIACIEHWFSLPENVREQLWRLYREAVLAQGIRPSHRQAAILAVATAHWVYQAELADAVEQSRGAVEKAKHHRRRALDSGERDPFEGLGLEDFFFDAESFEEGL